MIKSAVDFLISNERKHYLNGKRRKNRNKDFSLLSSNCNGGVILHDLGIRFNSPTVNLFMKTPDFLRFLSDPKKYACVEPVEIKSEMKYPVGKIDDIIVHFVHYSSFQEAKEKWVERFARINYENIYVMMTDRDSCTYEDLKVFDALPYKNKVVFTHKPYPEIKSAYYIKGFEEEDEVGVLSDYMPGLLRRRWIDKFDYVSFFNS